MKINKIWKPEIFQGSFRKKNYFEGWYFKIVDRYGENPLAFIPGLSIGNNADNSQAFIQILNGITLQSSFQRYLLRDFSSSNRSFQIRIGKNTFSQEGFTVDIQSVDISAIGSICFKDSFTWPVRPFSPGSMGWYSFVPFMECYHGIISMSSTLEGKILINRQTIDFSGGKGYIEKDWGTSFPKAWVWFQCNNFNNKSISVTGSIAVVPWMGGAFNGFIAGLLLNGTLYRFTTYTGAKLKELSIGDNRLSAVFKDRNYTLEVFIDSSDGGMLFAPTLGEMKNTITESLTSDIHIRFYENRGKRLLCEDRGTCSGLEMAGDLAALNK